MKSIFIFAHVFFLTLYFTFGEMSHFYSATNDDNAVYDEEPCALFGGNCVLRSLCRPYLRGLGSACPNQERKDVICCYGYSTEEKKCAHLNGSCIDEKAECHRFLTFKGAIDCPVGTKCCTKV